MNLRDYIFLQSEVSRLLLDCNACLEHAKFSLDEDALDDYLYRLERLISIDRDLSDPFKKRIMTKIQWVNSSQTLLRIDNRIINLGAVTQIILNEKLEENVPSHVTFYFGSPIGNSLHRENVPVSPETNPDSWWITFGEEKAVKLREFFAFN